MICVLGSALLTHGIYGVGLIADSPGFIDKCHVPSCDSLDFLTNMIHNICLIANIILLLFFSVFLM